MKVPEKIYVHEASAPELTEKLPYHIEYIRTDAFIEKACKFLKSYRQDTPDGTGYIACIVNDKTIENFVNYMK